MMIAFLSSLLGNIWFAALVGCLGFGFGWFIRGRNSK